MGGCPCQGTERQFDDAFARRDLKRYRSKGPDKTTRLILEAFRSRASSPLTLLDVGGGIGVLHHELLGESVSSAIHAWSPTRLRQIMARATRPDGERYSRAKSTSGCVNTTRVP